MTIEHTENQAWEQGYEARCEGKGQETNPYNPEAQPDEYMGWECGWHDADEEAEGEEGVELL